MATLLEALVFFALSVRWSLIDNSPPAWDQGLYVYQATIFHHALTQNGFFDFISAIFNVDRGRVPLLPLVAQPAFYFFGPSSDVGVISLNFAWFILAWAIAGLTRGLAGPKSGDKAGFFAFSLFGLYPITTLLSHNFLVEFLLTSFVGAAIYSMWLLYKTEKILWSLLAGVFIGLGLLTKVTYPAFVLPAFLIFSYLNVRKTSVLKTLVHFFPAILLATAISGPYYLYNLRQILAMTIGLSSSNLASMYGFGNPFEVEVVMQYLRAVFMNPPTLIAIICILIALLVGFIQACKKNQNSIDHANAPSKSLIIIMLVWFIIPFFLATFGTIKDPRYIYPGLLPIFVFAGVAISRFCQGMLATILVALVSVVPLSGYLYTNGFLSADSANQEIGPILAFYPDSRPDPQDWKLHQLVAGIANKVDALDEGKTIFFLGGNRYYHLRLLDYEGLKAGYRLTYMVLPYYSNPSMSLEEALKFIDDNSPAGILYKSGENWPPFSSHLDLGIVSQLKRNPKYSEEDIGIVQPDGSRFTLFINRSKNYAPIKSTSELVGNWKAGVGMASILSNSKGLIITTETGSQELAKIEEGVLSLPNWKILGRLTLDGQYIHWSNGFVWKREFDASNSTGRK